MRFKETLNLSLNPAINTSNNKASKSEMAIALNKLYKYNVKVNIHFVLDQHSIQTAINWINDDNEYLKNCNALIFLNYKPVGANKDKNRLLKNSSSLVEFFQLVEKLQTHR